MRSRSAAVSERIVGRSPTSPASDTKRNSRFFSMRVAGFYRDPIAFDPSLPAAVPVS
jgi:hypothetical protein